MKKVLYILTFITSVLGSAQNQSLFEEANDLYNNGKYSEAIQKYEAILNNGEHSSEVYFNLGNSHYKLNNIAPSIFYYEKALQLSPNDQEIINNLGYAQNMTIDAIEKVPELGLSRFLKKAINLFSFDTWALLTVLFVLLLVVFFLIYYFTHSTNRKRVSFISSLSFTAIACLCLAFAFQKFSMDKKNKPAIVFAQEALVRTDPNLSGSEAFRLHEGTKVQVLDTVNNWKKIKIADGKSGWIVSDDIKLLNDF